MIYKPRSHTHKRRTKTNWSATIEIIVGILAWTFVCGITWWAIYWMLVSYTEN